MDQHPPKPANDNNAVKGAAIDGGAFLLGILAGWLLFDSLVLMIMAGLIASAIASSQRKKRQAAKKADD